MGKEEVGNAGQVGVIKTLNHEILVTRAVEGDRENVMDLILDDDAGQEEIIRDARRGVEKDRWWLWEYWENKGLPKEQIELTDGKHNISLYNFQETPIGNDQLEQIQRILQFFSRIKGGIAFDRVEYILLDDVQGMNDKSGEPTNGYGPANSKAVTLYPNALKPIPNRVTDKVTNLEGTLTHEMTHGIPGMMFGEEMFFNMWTKTTGWKIGDERRVLPGGAIAIWETDYSRCVTEYAASDPDEDICESMVAYLFDPEKLDPTRLDFLQTHLPISSPDLQPWTYSRPSEVKLPADTPQELKVRLVGGIKIFTVLDSKK